jgi:hypothetical protein
VEASSRRKWCADRPDTDKKRSMRLHAGGTRFANAPDMMLERELVIQGLQNRLRLWEDSTDDLLCTVERSGEFKNTPFTQAIQELLDRRESARIQVARTGCATDDEFEDSRRECERKFDELSNAWVSAMQCVAMSGSVLEG